MNFRFYVEFRLPNGEWMRWNAVYDDALKALEAMRERSKFDDTFERRVVSQYRRDR